MAYRRGKRKTWSFQARTARGWKQLSTGVTDRVLATRIERMWERLVGEYRAWDLLDPVLEGRQDLGALFDLWERTDHDPHGVRRLLEDRDLEPLVADWFAVYTRKHPDTDSPAHALVHVRALLPEGQARKVSAVTTDWLTERLYAYPAGPATLVKLHASWSVFFDYCTRVRKLFTKNPMEDVEKPDVRRGADSVLRPRHGEAHRRRATRPGTASAVRTALRHGLRGVGHAPAHARRPGRGDERDSRDGHQDAHEGPHGAGGGVGVADRLGVREGLPPDRAPLAGDADPVHGERLAPRDGQDPRAAAVPAQERAASLGRADAAGTARRSMSCRRSSATRARS
jgi:hypothetical protein